MLDAIESLKDDDKVMESYLKTLTFPLPQRTDAVLRRLVGHGALEIQSFGPVALNYRAGAFVVMGPSTAGRDGTRSTIEMLTSIFERQEGANGVSWLMETFHEAHRAVCVDAVRYPSTQPASVTFAALHFEGDQLTILHTGSCRVYRLRQQRVRCLTTDDQGSMSAQHPFMPVFDTARPERGDLYLLCSTEALAHTTQEGLERILLDSGGSPQSCWRQMIPGAPSTASVVVVGMRP